MNAKLCAYLAARPLMIDHRVAASLGASASRFTGDAVDVDEQTGAAAGLPYKRTASGIAIVTIDGALVNRGAWIGSLWGAASYEGIKFQLQRAAADRKSRAIVLDISSPGGEANGAFEAADAVRAAGLVKPVYAIANGLAASAAYAIASAAGNIVVSPSGEAGSIGVIAVHMDYSRALDREGITPTIISAGAAKADGNSLQPLGDDARARIQGEIDQLYGLFVDTVVAGRDLTARQVRGMGAAVYMGQDAVDAGLADMVGTFEELMAMVDDETRAPRGRKMKPMDTIEIEAIDTAVDKEALASARAEGRAEAMKEAEAKAKESAAMAFAAGAAAERERILGIEASLFPGHDDLVAEMKADGVTTPDQAAGRILRAERAARAARVTAIAGVEMETSHIRAAAGALDSGYHIAPRDTPEAWREEWERDESVRADFPSADSYVNYCEGVAAGRIRILGNKADSFSKGTSQ